MDPYLGSRTSGEVRRVSRGLYAPVDGSDLDAWRLLLPDDAGFSHLTAARVHGLWLPPLPDDLPVFVSQHERHPRRRRPGLHVIRHPEDPPCVDDQSVPVVDVAFTLLTCARDLSVLDLVVLIDAALQLELVTTGDIAAVAGLRRVGAPRLRRALSLADGRSESAWETLLRVLHVTCEVPVEPQLDVFDSDGRFLGRADLRIGGTHDLHEYDGADHLLKQQQKKDLRRSRRLVNSQWVRRGYTSDDVLFRGVTILRDADLALGREHLPERIRPWHRLLAQSAFTPAGQQLLRHRLRLPSAETGQQQPA